MENSPIQTLSAGGVVLNDKGEVLIVSQRENAWSLPKGHVERGEDSLAAARREIHEESGISDLQLLGTLGRYTRLKPVSNRYNNRPELKTIDIFLFRTRETYLNPLDEDNLEARWVPIDIAMDMLTYKEDREFFVKIADRVKQSI